MEGRVELQYEGVWGTVCEKNWDKKDADVVCRTLGYDQANSKNCCPKFGQGTGPIVVDDAQCTGKEIGLSFCRIRGWGLSKGCTHAHDVGVNCEFKPGLFEYLALSSINHIKAYPKCYFQRMYLSEIFNNRMFKSWINLET